MSDKIISLCINCTKYHKIKGNATGNIHYCKDGLNIILSLPVIVKRGEGGINIELPDVAECNLYQKKEL